MPFSTDRPREPPPTLLANLDESATNSGRRVGRQAEMIPLAHSMRHHVLAVASVQGVSAGSNWKSEEKR